MTPWLPPWLLPLTLALCALAAAVLAGQGVLPAWLVALALLTSCAGALLAGAFWSRQRQLDRLRSARLHTQLLGQMLDVWCWQTDAEHRLVKLQPPQGAPGSAWAGSAFGGDLFWDRFDDIQHSLQPRMQAQSALGELLVQQHRAGETDGDAQARPWRLRGLPRFDGRGRFDGYVGVAWPAAAAQQAQAASQALDTLFTHGPAVLCLAQPAADGQGWRLARASPGACRLLGLAAGADFSALPWSQALAGLPEPLRAPVLALQPGHSAALHGWQARLDALGQADPAGNAPCAGLLLSLVPTDGGNRGGSSDDSSGGSNEAAAAALVSEHAAFTYTISHDLRAPIRVIEGFGRILKEDYGSALDRVGRDHIDRVTAAAARMGHMIDALLSLSNLSVQPLQRQPVNLTQLAGFVVDELRRGAPERQVSVHIAPGMVAQGDPTLLRMALENLLGNAWKYSAKVPQAVIRFEPELVGGRHGYQISDNGAGFDMRFADRLFGVFQRLHSSSDFQGTGVGLASVRRIVRRHGGDIWAESEVGQGARFHFCLKD